LYLHSLVHDMGCGCGATQKRGLIVRPSDFMIMLSPPLILTADQIDEIVGILEQSLEEVASEMRLDGTH